MNKFCRFYFVFMVSSLINMLCFSQVEGNCCVYFPLQEKGLISVIEIPSGVEQKSISVGVNPIKVVNHPSYSEVYVLNGGTDTQPGSVSVIDPVRGIVIATIPVGLSPVDMAIHPEGRELYIANSKSHSVTIVNLCSRSVRKDVQMDIIPQFLALMPTGKKLYVVDQDASSVGVIAVKSATYITKISVGIGPGIPCINPNGLHCYIPNHRDGTISVIDTNKDLVTQTARVTRPNHLLNMFMSSSGKVMYVPDLNSAYILSLDPKTFALQQEIDGWVNGQNRIIIFSPEGKNAFGLSDNQGSVLVIDVEKGTTGQIIPGNGSPLVGGGITPDGAYLVVIGQGAPGDLLVINLKSLSLEKMISIGSTNGSMAFGKTTTP